MIKFRLAENLALDYSDFRDEGLRVAIFARSGGGKSNLAALFAEEALEQGLQTLIIEPLREYNTLKKLYDGKFEMFYKDDEQSYFPICKKSARYADGWRYCSKCQCFYQNKCKTHDTKLRNSPRKKKRK